MGSWPRQPSPLIGSVHNRCVHHHRCHCLRQEHHQLVHYDLCTARCGVGVGQRATPSQASAPAEHASTRKASGLEHVAAACNQPCRRRLPRSPAACLIVRADMPCSERRPAARHSRPLAPAAADAPPPPPRGHVCPPPQLPASASWRGRELLLCSHAPASGCGRQCSWRARLFSPAAKAPRAVPPRRGHAAADAARPSQTRPARRRAGETPRQHQCRAAAPRHLTAASRRLPCQATCHGPCDAEPCGNRYEKPACAVVVLIIPVCFSSTLRTRRLPSIRSPSAVLFDNPAVPSPAAS